MREKYNKMKDMNDHLLKQLENDQQELDRLTMKKAELEDVSSTEYKHCVQQLLYG